MCNHSPTRKRETDALKMDGCAGGGLTPTSLLSHERGGWKWQRLLHVQCNSGQDSLSLAVQGAFVTGVDISDEAVPFARKLSQDSGIPATFERADIYEWFAAMPSTAFDSVFASYGVLSWLSDLDRWAKGIAAALVPGGRFVLVEFHPMAIISAVNVEEPNNGTDRTVTGVGVVGILSQLYKRKESH